MIEALLLIACGPLLQAGEEATQSVWSKIADEHIAGYTLSPTSGGTEEYERIEQPVTQHVQNVRHKAVGSVYVWRDRSGRPVAVCDVFFLSGSGRSFQLFDEWHSLTDESMIARWNGSLRWSPQEPGLTWEVIPNADVPADSQVRRNLQVRRLSRRFTANIADSDGQRYELRMLPTPIFAFETTDSDESLGGGLFAFCQGNDPEVLLLIEARTHEDDVRWEYAVAEFSNRPQFVELDGEPVWDADPPRFSTSGRHTGGARRAVEIPQATQAEESN